MNFIKRVLIGTGLVFFPCYVVSHDYAQSTAWGVATAGAVAGAGASAYGLAKEILRVKKARKRGEAFDEGVVLRRSALFTVLALASLVAAVAAGRKGVKEWPRLRTPLTPEQAAQLDQEIKDEEELIASEMRGKLEDE